MKSFIHKLILCLLIVLPLLIEANDSCVPLSARTFKCLEAGEPQTVIVYGTSVSIGGQWAKEVDAYFKTNYPGQVTFFNSAKSGMQSKWGVANLKERVLDKKPDLVFIEFAINDAATKHGISIEDCEKNLDTMVKALQQQNPQIDIVLQTMNPAWDSPAIEKNYASDRPHLADYYEVYRGYAKKNNLPLVDNYPVWKKIMDEDLERYKVMVPDGIHPQSDPNRKIAWPPIKALLDEARVAAWGSTTVNVWPEEKMPGKGAKEPEALRSPERTDAIRITNISTPRLTLFPAKDTKEPAPLVIVCPGGGYGYVVVDKEGSEIAKWLNSLGISAALLKYRNPNNREGALQDIQRAIRVVRTHATEWTVDPERVGVIGFSAGGNLCAKASNRFKDKIYEPIDAIDKLSCRPDFAMLVYPAYLERDGKIADDLNLDVDIPPTLIVHNEDDSHFIAGSKLYADALKEKKHPYKFLLYPTGGHGYGLRSSRDAKAWPKDAELWLRENGLTKE